MSPPGKGPSGFRSRGRALSDRVRDRNRPGDNLSPYLLDLGDKRARHFWADRAETDPPFRREKREVRPVLKVPRTSSSIVSKTATSSLFTALVRMCRPRWDWSTSTPIPQIPYSVAASSAPSPQALATWNTTRDPFAIWLRATDLPFTGSRKSSV